MPNIIHREVFAGEDRTLTLYARDQSNVPLSLTGSTVSWRVGRGPRCPDSSWPIFTKTGTVTDSAAGTFTVTVAAADTQYLAGDYEHEGWVTNASAQVSVVTQGRLRVRPYITA